jgi:anti-anti-sigma factor
MFRGNESLAWTVLSIESKTANQAVFHLPMFTIIATTAAQTRTLRCKGQLVSGDAVKHLLSIATSEKPAVLVLDLAELHTIDAAGVGLLVKLTNWSDAGGRTLRLVNLTEWVATVLHLCALDILLPIARREKPFSGRVEND